MGFSSLGSLKRLPLSMIKLDRTFVENLSEGSHDAAIVRAVNEMADTIGIGVVAEGIETRTSRCGWRAPSAAASPKASSFSEPVPVGQVERLLERPMPAFT